MEYAREGSHKGIIPAAHNGASFLETPVGDAIGELTPTIRADLEEAGIAGVANLTYMNEDRGRRRTFSSAWPYIMTFTQVSDPLRVPAD